MKELDKDKEYYIRLTSQEDFDISIDYLKNKGYKEYSSHITNKEYSKKYPILMISTNLEYYTRDSDISYYKQFEELKISDFIESNQLKPEDLIKDKWYYIETNSNWIIKFDYNRKDIIFTSFSCTINKDYYNGRVEWGNLGNGIIRLATKEEVLKYFPYEKFEEDVLETFPFKVKIIKNDSSSNWYNLNNEYTVIKSGIDKNSKVYYIDKDESYYILADSTEKVGNTKEQIQFVEEKWYRRMDYSKDFIKFKYLEIDCGLSTKYNKVHYSELIEYGKHNYTSNYWANTEMARYALENPVSLEEIQQYLPDNHVDKIKPKIMETKLDKEELLRIAKEKYPIGCKFYSVGSNTTIEMKGEPYFTDYSGLILWNYGGGGRIYSENSWAEIISLPESNSINSDNFPEKWCIQWKTREIYEAVNRYFKQHWQYLEEHSNSWVDNFGKYYSYINKPIEKLSDFTEITFEQFKAKFIDKDDIQEYGIYISPIPTKEFSNINIKQNLVTIEESYKPELKVLSKPKIVKISIVNEECKVKSINKQQTIKI